MKKILLIIAILFAYFISKYVTRPLETIRLKIDQTGLLEQNEKIYLKNATKEVFSLINSYNEMIDETPNENNNHFTYNEENNFLNNNNETTTEVLSNNDNRFVYNDENIRNNNDIYNVRYYYYN